MFDHRFVSFEGAFNVRDLGGLPTAEGRVVRSGRVYRADSPNFLTDADRARVAALDVVQVIDLRSGPEADEGTWATHPDMRYGRFEVINPAQNPNGPAGHQLPDPFDHDAFARRYLKRLIDGGPTFAEAARTLTRSVDEGVIFHCSAGKDRTGLLAAFVLSVIGVDRQLIVDDYAASTEPMERKMAFHETNPIPGVDPARYPPLMFQSPAPVMAQLLDLADEHFGPATGAAEGAGGIVACFQQSGFTDAEVDDLRLKLLA